MTNSRKRVLLFVALLSAVLAAVAWACRPSPEIADSRPLAAAAANPVVDASMDATLEDKPDATTFAQLESRLALLEERNVVLDDRLTAAENDRRASAQVVKKMGAAAGYVFVGGEQRFQNFTRAREYAVDWVTVPANTWTTIYTMPALVSGELNVYAGLAIITYDNSDAAVNCDAGMCDGVIRRYVPGRYQGGDFCRPDGVCASSGAFDMAVDWVVTDSGIMTGAGARISWTSPSLVMQVFCPTSCRAAGGISGQAMKPVLDAAVADTGVDAADAADAADSSDAGIPTISGFALTAQNFGSAAAYTPGTLPVLNGTNFTGATSVLLDGAEHVSNVTVASTTITFNTLALSGHTPAAYKNVVVVTPSGTATWGQPHGDGALTGWTTVSGGSACAVADWVTFGTPPAIASFIQLCDLAFTPTQATAGNQANQATGGSGINGFAVAQVAHTGDTYPFASIAAFAAGDGILVGSQKSGGHSFTPWQIGNAAAADTWLPLNTGNLYSNFGVSTTYWCSAQAPVAPVTTASFASPFMSEEQMTSGGVGTLWANGTQQCTSSGHTAAFPATPSLLASAGAPQTGLPEVAAWFLFNSALSAANADVVYAYAGGRYNISYVAR